MKRSFVVGIAGGTGSGKGYFARRLAESFPDATTTISLDMYYKDEGGISPTARLTTNVDNPGAFDFDLAYRNLTALLSGHPATQPVYDYESRLRTNQTTTLSPQPLILVEGILALSDPRLLASYNLKIYLEADPDLRLARRLLRDLKEKRHETLDYSINQYLTSARPSHKLFVEPQKAQADLIIDWNEDNNPALAQVVDIINKELKPLWN